MAAGRLNHNRGSDRGCARIIGSPATVVEAVSKRDNRRELANQARLGSAKALLKELVVEGEG